MKKWTWLTVPVAVMGLALVFWGGTVFAQEPAKTPVDLSGNSTGMADYCRSAGGMGGMSGMGGMMDGTMAMTGVNGTEMQNYCQNMMSMMDGSMMDGGMMGAGNMTRHGGMMGGGGMMGASGMMGR